MNNKYHYAPRKFEDEQQTHIIPADPSIAGDVEFWSIYEVMPDGTDRWVTDMYNKEIAEHVTLLLNKDG